MEINQAFEIFNLPITASKEEIKTKYKELSKSFHPDKGGSEKKMADLNTAKDVATEFVSNKSLIKVVQELTKVDNKVILRSQQVEREVTALSNRIVKRVGNKLKTFKDTTVFIGILSALTSLVSTKIIPIMDFPKDSIIGKMAIIFTVITGFYYLLIKQKVTKLEDKVTEFKESLDDKEFLHHLLSQILITKKGMKITKLEFIDLIQEWQSTDNRLKKISEDVDVLPFPWIDEFRTPAKICRLIGVNDFSKLLLLKGEQQNLVFKEEVNNKNRFEIKYIIG